MKTRVFVHVMTPLPGGGWREQSLQYYNPGDPSQLYVGKLELPIGVGYLCQIAQIDSIPGPKPGVVDVHAQVVPV